MKTRLLIILVLSAYSTYSQEVYKQVSGSVRDIKGNPLKGVSVEIENVAIACETDEKGRFVLKNVPKKDAYKIHLQKDDFHAAMSTEFIFPDESGYFGTLYMRLEIEKGITVIIKDSETKIPLKEVKYKLPLSQMVVSNNQMIFIPEEEILPYGKSITIVFEKDEYMSLDTTLRDYNGDYILRVFLNKVKQPLKKSKTNSDNKDDSSRKHNINNREVGISLNMKDKFSGKLVSNQMKVIISLERKNNSLKAIDQWVKKKIIKYYQNGDKIYIKPRSSLVKIDVITEGYDEESFKVAVDQSEDEIVKDIFLLHDYEIDSRIIDANTNKIITEPLYYKILENKKSEWQELSIDSHGEYKLKTKVSSALLYENNGRLNFAFKNKRPGSLNIFEDTIQVPFPKTEINVFNFDLKVRPNRYYYRLLVEVRDDLSGNLHLGDLKIKIRYNGTPPIGEDDVVKDVIVENGRCEILLPKLRKNYNIFYKDSLRNENIYVDITKLNSEIILYFFGVENTEEPNIVKVFYWFNNLDNSEKFTRETLEKIKKEVHSRVDPEINKHYASVHHFLTGIVSFIEYKLSKDTSLIPSIKQCFNNALNSRGGGFYENLFIENNYKILKAWVDLIFTPFGCMSCKDRNYNITSIHDDGSCLEDSTCLINSVANTLLFENMLYSQSSCKTLSTKEINKFLSQLNNYEVNGNIVCDRKYYLSKAILYFQKFKSEKDTSYVDSSLIYFGKAQLISRANDRFSSIDIERWISLLSKKEFYGEMDCSKKNYLPTAIYQKKFSTPLNVNLIEEKIHDKLIANEIDPKTIDLIISREGFDLVIVIIDKSCNYKDGIYYSPQFSQAVRLVVKVSTEIFFSRKISISGWVVGEADARPVKLNGITYNGEFGFSTTPIKFYSLAYNQRINDFVCNQRIQLNSSTINLMKDSKLYNTQLAFVRGYSVKSILEGLNFSCENFFVLTRQNHSIGSGWRKTTAHIVIKNYFNLQPDINAKETFSSSYNNNNTGNSESSRESTD